MVDIVITDDQGVRVGQCGDFSLDLRFGESDQNNYELALFGSPITLQKNYQWRIDGTEYGGIIDQTNVDTSSANSFAGLDWHGLLQARVLQPDSGADYLTVSGDLNAVIGQMLERCGLTDVFTSSPDSSGVSVKSYQFDRYAYLYDGLKKMCASQSMKLRLAWDEESRRVMVSAVPQGVYADSVDNDLLDFTAKIAHNRINHLIALGKGDLKDRIVQHWYADAKGVVSQTQSIFGVDERIEVYDYSSAEADELTKEAKQKLEEYQSMGEINVTITDDATSFDIGDLITARDNASGIKVSATVSKKIVKATGAGISVSYETTAKTI